MTNSMTRRPTKRFYLFDGFRVDASERLLFKENREVPLTPKVFDTLLVLLENSSHVLTKKELMQQVWPDSFVEENNLAQNISILRKALGEGKEGEHYIQTVPKRGYRFVGRRQNDRRRRRDCDRSRTNAGAGSSSNATMRTTDLDSPGARD